MRSLFVVSLPRSLSSLVYYVVRNVLRLQAPSWTTDGEILNVDRFCLYPRHAWAPGIKFTQRTRDPRLFQAILDFLNQVAMPEGFAYKDVVHPFVVSEWLTGRDFRVLRIKRNIADVAYSMLDKHWYYPQLASTGNKTVEAGVIEGLLRVDRLHDRLRAVHANYDEVVANEQVLVQAVRSLYPGVSVGDFRYINDEFRTIREQVLARRQSPRYMEIDRLVNEISATLASG